MKKCDCGKVFDSIVVVDTTKTERSINNWVSYIRSADFLQRVQ
jgi:hypothetical protein